MTIQSKVLFTPGPVMMDPETIRAGAVQIPYSRTDDFTKLVLFAESSLLRLLNAPAGSRVAFITGSGTAAMEAALLNFIPASEKVSIVDGGAFGHRFVEICERHQIACDRLTVDRDPLTDGAELAKIKGATAAIIVNAHETSIGHMYDLTATAKTALAHDALHIVDAISIFATDAIDMSKQHIDVLILSSNKGLALAPGLAMLVLTPKAISRIVPDPRSYYLDVKAILSNGDRGQTPFTPAIGIFLQLAERLHVVTPARLGELCDYAGQMARHFRAGISTLPLSTYSQHMPNAMTAVQVETDRIKAPEIVRRLNMEYGLMVGPNGGALADKVFRVSHMGNLKISNIDALLAALTDILSSTGKAS